MSKINDSFRNYLLDYTRFLQLMQERDAQNRKRAFYDKFGQEMRPKPTTETGWAVPPRNMGDLGQTEGIASGWGGDAGKFYDEPLLKGKPAIQMFQPESEAWRAPLTKTTMRQPDFRTAAQNALLSDPEMGADAGFLQFMQPEQPKPPVYNQFDTTKDIFKNGELWRKGMPPIEEPKGYTPGTQLRLRPGEYEQVPGERWKPEQPEEPKIEWKVTFDPIRKQFRNAKFVTTPDGVTTYQYIGDEVVDPYILKSIKATATGGTSDEEIGAFSGQGGEGKKTQPEIETPRIQGWNPNWDTDYKAWLEYYRAIDDTTNQRAFSVQMKR